ncbi:hypothetical protein [Acidicapsa acidisoli]|uniref:hypothetical protein n=1 Tax=Acidicapsa acidisoli TaxID=1615681 RepID=UPI0037C1A511
MAPELVFGVLQTLRPGSVILDSMAGSGTVLRVAAESGHEAIGFDVDPLAVLMSKVWTTPVDDSKIEGAAEGLILKAKQKKSPILPWIDSSEETTQYVNFWFEPKQATQLRRIASALKEMRGPMADVLRVALSRTIVTKERGASVARDTSHSRPHRVFFGNDFDVYGGLLRSAQLLANRLGSRSLKGKVTVCRGDSRKISRIASHSVDAVVTSPPYLNAIDYLRGHRLSLVWLGYSVESLRDIRSGSIGTERSAPGQRDGIMTNTLLRDAGTTEQLTQKEAGMVERYAGDVYQFMKQLRHSIKEDGQVLLVVGDSCLRGISISNANINVAAARLAEFKLVSQFNRPLPMAKRYLPVPSANLKNSLSKRMRYETILKLVPQ